MKVWGLWHQREKCWFGNDEKPNQYTDYKLAQAAATVATEMFCSLVRPSKLPKKLAKTTKIKATYTGATALARIERRRRK